MQAVHIVMSLFLVKKGNKIMGLPHEKNAVRLKEKYILLTLKKNVFKHKYLSLYFS